MLVCIIVNTPATAGPGDVQCEEHVDMEQAKLYRKSAARVAYPSQDRPNMSHASCTLEIAFSNPTSIDMLRLKG